MDEAIKKKAIVQAMSEIECYPIIQEDTDVQEYTKVPLGQISATTPTRVHQRLSQNNLRKRQISCEITAELSK